MRYGRVSPFVLLLCFVMPTVSSSGQGRNRPAAPSKPAPHFADGTPNLGITLQERGLWLPLDRTDLGRRSTLAPVETIPFQPWAKALYDDRQIHELEPHTRCHPSGVARQFQTPYGVEFVNLSDLQRMYIFDVGGPHTFRIIYMDGRSHPDKLDPAPYGHSVGHWENDTTLVIDTTGLDERPWLDTVGHPRSSMAHIQERYRRVDQYNIQVTVTVDDPKFYTKPWTFMRANLYWMKAREFPETLCVPSEAIEYRDTLTKPSGIQVVP